MPEDIYPFEVIHPLEEANEVLSPLTDPTLVYAIPGFTHGLEVWPYPYKEEHSSWPDGADGGMFIDAVISLRVGDRVCWLNEERAKALSEALELSLKASRQRFEQPEGGLPLNHPDR